MPSSPRVSIVIIFRDAERFLGEAVESALAQEGVDLELVLVDDGSADGGPELAERAVAAGGGRVRLVRHPEGANRGMSASRNLGVGTARGRWIAFLDADDRFREGKLAAQLDELDREPEALALAAPAEYWYSWSGAEEDRQRDFVQRWTIATGRLAEPPEVLDMYLADEWNTLCDVVVRRDAYLALGGYEEAFAGMYEDQVFHAKLALGGPIRLSGRSFYRYRQHADSCTSRSAAAGRSDAARERFRDWLEGYLDRRGLDLPATRTLLRRPVGGPPASAAAAEAAP